MLLLLLYNYCVFVLYTGERRWEFVVELVDVVVIDVLPLPVVVLALVLDEPLFSDGCNRHCEAKENRKEIQKKTNRE